MCVPPVLLANAVKNLELEKYGSPYFRAARENTFRTNDADLRCAVHAVRSLTYPTADPCERIDAAVKFLKHDRKVAASQPPDFRATSQEDDGFARLLWSFGHVPSTNLRSEFIHPQWAAYSLAYSTLKSSGLSRKVADYIAVRNKYLIQVINQQYARLRKVLVKKELPNLKLEAVKD